MEKSSDRKKYSRRFVAVVDNEKFFEVCNIEVPQGFTYEELKSSAISVLQNPEAYKFNDFTLPENFEIRFSISDGDTLYVINSQNDIDGFGELVNAAKIEWVKGRIMEKELLRDDFAPLSGAGAGLGHSGDPLGARSPLISDDGLDPEIGLNYPSPSSGNSSADNLFKRIFGKLFGR